MQESINPFPKGKGVKITVENDHVNKEVEKKTWKKPELEVLDISHTKYWEFKQQGDFFINNEVAGLEDFS